MNKVPRQTLRRILAKYGNDLCGNARRCEGLLKDLCGEYRREINVLTNAIDERIPLDLLAAGNSMPRELLLTRLARRLEDNLGLTKEASYWAVDSWALALGVITEAEIEEREKKQSNSAPSFLPTNAPPPSQQNSKIQPPKTHSPSQTRQSQPPQRPSQTHPKPQPPQTLPKQSLPKVYPPIARTPVNVPMPKSPQRSGLDVNVPHKSPQSINPGSNAIPKRRFGKFFGCLFVFFLLVAAGTILFFGVPYAINVMRETQQSELPRFPPQ
ncbi:MAG: hypothetical protein LC778_10640 [Acidobacteria bacterium]|nr:hypothetical protein [Acidobacteriota bacterium]